MPDIIIVTVKYLGKFFVAAATAFFCQTSENRDVKSVTVYGTIKFL